MQSIDRKHSTIENTTNSNEEEIDPVLDRLQKDIQSTQNQRLEIAHKHLITDSNQIKFKPNPHKTENERELLSQSNLIRGATTDTKEQQMDYAELQSTIRILNNRLLLKEKEADRLRTLGNTFKETKKSNIINAYKDQLEDKQMIIHKYERDLQNKTQEVQSMKVTIENLKGSPYLDDKYRELSAQCEVLNAENERLKAEVLASNEEINKKASYIEMFVKEKKDMENEITSLSEKLKSIPEYENEALKTKCSQLQKYNEELEEHNKRVEKEIFDLKNEIVIK